MNLTRLFTALLAPLFSLFIAAQLHAQSNQDVQIWVGNVEKPVQLRKLDVDAKVYGFMANTKLTLEFHNPNNRVLEGEFVLPLLANQRVVGYALEVNGVLREGVVVPKQTARIAFEEITRRGVDPGLAEITRGNVFRTRIYPIPARGNKRISITIEQALEKHGSGMRYLMPVPVKTKLAEYRVRVEAVQASAENSGAGLKLSDAKIAERSLTNAVPDSPITLDLPANDAPMVYSIAESGSPFLQVIAQVQAPINKVIAQKPVNTLAIYWDSSRSGKARQLAKELAFLRAVMSDKNIKTVSLSTFAISAGPARKFARQADDFAALFKAIAQIDYDGATQLDSLSFSDAADLALIFTDADSTFEHYSSSAAALTRRPALGAARHVIAHAALSANAQGLGALAHRLNAVRLDLTRVDIATAMQLANSPPTRAIATVASGQCQQSPNLGAVESGISYLSARCKQGTNIRVSWNQENAPEAIIKVPAPMSNNARASQPISRAWASETILRLQQTGQSGFAQSPESVSAQSLRLALQYALVTEQTSLLVLDSIEDYVNYDIAPPEPELRAQFDAMRKVNISEANSEKSIRLASLTGAWQEFKRHHQSQHAWVGRALVPFALNLSARVTEPKAKQQFDKLLKRAEALAALEAQKGLAQSTRREALSLIKALQQIDSDWLARLPKPERTAELAKRATATIRSQNPFELSRQRGGEGLADFAVAAPAPMATAPAAEASISEESETLDSISVTGSRIKTERKESDSADDSDDAASATRASVAIKPYTANAPYLTRIRAGKDPYATYLIEAQADGSVGFYLDCAEYFYSERKQPELALRVLSNIAETQVEDVGALRALAEQLRQWQFHSFSLANFQQVMQLRTEEPQGARDFALALARAPDNAGGNSTLALTLLWHVASHDWDQRFNSIQLTALHEFNDVLAATPAKLRPNLQVLGVPDALVSPLPVGLRVVLGWNANDVDIDLWVRDPLGEWAYYAQRQTESGGQMSDDFTQGYGPETFTIAKPIPGKYTVYAHYYGNSQQKLSVPITVYLEFQTPFGSGKSANTAVVRRLDTSKQDQEIGEFTVLE